MKPRPNSRSSNNIAYRYSMILFAFCTFSLCSVAQSGRGSISGQALDTAGAALQGAKVEIMPGNFVVNTDGQGDFNFNNLAPGKYTISVSYVGFTRASKYVDVAAGQSARFNAVLSVATKGEEITVTADRVHGEAEAINRTRASDNIIQVLPFEVITSLPNTNIADALGRLPSVTLERDEGEGKYVQIRGTEPRLSNVTVNGVNVPSPEGGVRQIKLDTIPANLVESVEINKTLSANQDGDAIGGSVNLVTKTAEEKPTLYLNAIGGYTPIVNGRKLYETDGTIGKRFGAGKKLGILFGGSYDWNGRGIDDVEPVPTAVQCAPGGQSCENPGSSAPYFATYGGQDLREYRYYRTRYGFAGSVDYKLNEGSGLYVRGIYSHFNNYGDRWAYSPAANSSTDSSGNPLSGYLTPGQTDANGSSAFNVSIRRPVDVIGSLAAGGKHVLPKWVLLYDFSLSRSSEEDHGYAQANFTNPNSYQFNIVTTDPLAPKFVPVGGYSSFFNLSNYFLNNGDVSTTYSPQVNIQGAASAARSYNWAGHFGTFEFGFKLRNAHKFQDFADNYYFVNPNLPSSAATDPALAASNFPNSFVNNNYYNGAYKFGPTVDYSKVQAFINGPGTAFLAPDVVSTQQNTIPNNYDLIERITAGYLMNTLDFGRFRLQTGLRFEATSESVTGNNVALDPTTGALTAVTPVNTNSSYLDPLPSVQLRYNLPHDAAIRASYGRGISRPNFSDLPPYLTHNGPNQEIDIGNPNLKAEHANNYDLLYEKYLKPLGLLQAGFFYKQLSDPIYEGVKSAITTDAYGAFYNGGSLVEPLNGKSASLYGFEIAYQQHLTFLPGFLGGVGISANYGYSHSSTDGVPGRSDSPALLRQAPNTFNISPTYDRGRLSMRLGISYNGANIFQYNYFNLNPDGSPNPQPLGKKGPLGDVYLYAHTQVDAQGTVRLYRSLQLIVSGLNLTNEVFGFYQGSPQYVLQREYYKPSYEVGLRYTLSNEPK